MLVSTRKILLDAQKNNYAVPAFNIHNLETIQVVLEKAQELKSPVIIATTPGTVKYAGKENLLAIMEAYTKKLDIPVAFHLDHHESIEDIKESIRLGCKSVMIDASHYDLEKNIDIVKDIVEFAHKYDATVEAELGKLSGVEDDLVVDEKDANYTNPQEAIRFVKETGIDTLAIAIGTAHGLYKEEPKIDMERLEAIRECVAVPLVLHGASGVAEDVVEETIRKGISKVNIATELKIPFSNGLREYLVNNPNANDPRHYFSEAKEAMSKVVEIKIRTCNSFDRV